MKWIPATCLPKIESKSLWNAVNALYWTKSTVVEYFAIERCRSNDAKDKTRTKRATHFILDLNTIFAEHHIPNPVLGRTPTNKSNSTGLLYPKFELQSTNLERPNLKSSGAGSNLESRVGFSLSIRKEGVFPSPKKEGFVFLFFFIFLFVKWKKRG